MPKTNSGLVQEKQLRLLPLGDLKVSAESQREFKQYHADDLLARFDLDEMETPHIHRREDGSLYIVDGQHSVWALKHWLGEGADKQKLHCWVYETGLDGEKAEKWEARKFRALNHRLNTNVFDDFRLAVKAGEPDDMEILRTVQSQELVISKDDVPGAIRAVGTLRKVYRRADAVVLGRALRIIRDAYGDPGLEAKVIDGVGHLCQRYNGVLDEEFAVEKLSAAFGGVNGLLSKAEVLHKQTGNTKAHCVAAAAVQIINTKATKAKKLPDWWAS